MASNMTSNSLQHAEDMRRDGQDTRVPLILQGRPTNARRLYITLISACEKAWQWQPTPSLLKEMWAMKLGPAVVGHSTPISACEKYVQWQPGAATTTCEKCGQWQSGLWGRMGMAVAAR